MLWSREQRTALILATAIGAVVGALLAVTLGGACFSPYHGSASRYVLGYDWLPLIGHCWSTLIGLPVFGGSLGCALIVIMRLMKN